MKSPPDTNDEKIKILVTGATGFIGRNIVKKLAESKKNEITIVGFGSEPSIEGIHKILHPTLEGIDWKQVYNHDIVIHQMANNDTRCQDRDEIWRANVFGPITLFNRAVDGRCRKFVYASSTAVYGNSPAPYTENETTVAPLNLYGESKAAFDNFAMEFAHKNKASVIGLRYCNVYGPGEEYKGKRMSMVGQLINQIRDGRRPKIFKNGEQKRDWVYIDDVVQANMLAMESSSAKGSIYNIGSGKSISFNGLIDLIRKQYQRDKMPWIEYTDCPFENEYQDYTECNIEKARRELNYSPSFDLRSGIKNYADYLIRHPYA